MWPGPDQWKWRALLGLDSWLKSGTQGGYRLYAASGHTPPFCSQGAFQPEMKQTLKGSLEETCAFYGAVESTVPVACFLLDFQRSPNKAFWVGFGSLKSPSLLLRANCPSSSSGREVLSESGDTGSSREFRFRKCEFKLASSRHLDMRSVVSVPPVFRIPLGKQSEYTEDCGM